MHTRMDDSVKLTSGDGFSFILPHKVASMSPTIRNMIDSGFTESLSGTITFPEIKASVLEKVIQYLWYKYRYSADHSGGVPEFSFDLEMSLELLMAADYLDC